MEQSNQEHTNTNKSKAGNASDYSRIKGDANISLSAKKTLGIIMFFSIFIICCLVGVIIWQHYTISNLRVEVEQVKIRTFLETEDLIISEYWLKQKSSYEQLVGKKMLETNQVLLESMNELTQGDENK